MKGIDAAFERGARATTVHCFLQLGIHTHINWPMSKHAIEWTSISSSTAPHG